MTFKRFFGKTDLYLLAAIALGGLTLAILSALDRIDADWCRIHLGTIAVGIATCAAGAAGAIVHRLATANETQESLQASLNTLCQLPVADRLEGIEDALSKLQLQTSMKAIDSLDRCGEQLNQNLAKIFGHYVEEMGKNIQNALNHETLELTDPEIFRSFYRKALEQFPGATLHATSTPTQTFFWSQNDSVLPAMESFILAGGTIIRIFFLKSEADLLSPEVSTILQDQHRINVKVHTVLINDVPREYQKNVVVDTQNRFGWEVRLSPTGSMNWAQLTSSAKLLRHSEGCFDAVWNTRSRKPFKPEQIMEPEHGATLPPVDGHSSPVRSNEIAQANGS